MSSLLDQVKAARRVSTPLLAILTPDPGATIQTLQEGLEGGKTPMVPFEDLYTMGFKLISYSGTLQRTAIKGMLNVLGVLKKEGTTNSVFPSQICSLMERSELLGLQQFYELEERLYGPLMDTEGSWRAELAQHVKARSSDVRSALPL